ncbi:hypothetical protein JJB07_05405 [Tumebacillus sp. ITR2]|uniref:Uncharacterized protein n=1 Tax=Tumebacillus amylolyticus TaxID=2801339 RepID=A0ABS1J7A5_9BACL|nr:CBO0543 family protein [Tumebacillus amylolyticus]MBL0386085.1 hypothetical protein [Tumebacillus amylolyticus]
MSKEFWILVSLWVVIPVALWRLTPKSRTREMHLVFMSMQTFTWLFDILVVQFGLIEYPYREFPHATRMNFTLHFLLYPSLAVVFMLYFPEAKPKWVKALYTVLFSAGIAAIAVVIERYTHLVHLVSWRMSLSFEIILFCNVLTRLFVASFFKKKGSPS